MEIRKAVPADAQAISRMLGTLVSAGKRTSRADEDFVLATYIENPEGILCVLALDEGGGLLGFQSVVRTSAGNRYGTPEGWGFIGTHVAPEAGRRGVGSRLFEATRAAAEAARLPAIEAFIGATNVEGQAYYEKMGFRTYRIADGAICKCYRLA